MDLKLWEYIFEMFNYKIRQKQIDFLKITNPFPALNAIVEWGSVGSRCPALESLLEFHLFQGNCRHFLCL